VDIDTTSKTLLIEKEKRVRGRTTREKGQAPARWHGSIDLFV
jgi:hypothetical protein